jgi:16S rRNA (guanine966-N2)-methyltransferase
MRITGGQARGIPLKAPPGQGTRPATDALREALFSRLGPRLAGARCLDLYAGTGSYGLEALSRGAAFCHFIESHTASARCLQSNWDAVSKSLQASGATERTAQIQNLSVEQALPALAAEAFDVIFADPPYALGEAAFTRVATAFAGSPLILCWEAPGRTDLHHPAWQEVRKLGKKGDGPSLRIFEAERDAQ